MHAYLCARIQLTNQGLHYFYTRIHKFDSTFKVLTRFSHACVRTYAKSNQKITRPSRQKTRSTRSWKTKRIGWPNRSTSHTKTTWESESRHLSAHQLPPPLFPLAPFCCCHHGMNPSSWTTRSAPSSTTHPTPASTTPRLHQDPVLIMRQVSRHHFWRHTSRVLRYQWHHHSVRGLRRRRAAVHGGCRGNMRALARTRARSLSLSPRARGRYGVRARWQQQTPS